MLTAWNTDGGDSSSVSIEFNGKVFETGKDKYYVEISITSGAGLLRKARWEITPNVGEDNIPAVRLAGGTPDSIIFYPGYFTGTYADNIYAAINFSLGATSGVNTGISSITKISESGSSSITTGDTRIYLSGNEVKEKPLNIVIKINSEIPVFLPVSAEDPNVGVGVAMQFYNVSAEDAKITNCTTGDMSDIEDAINYQNVVDTAPINQVYTIRCHLKENGIVDPSTSKAYDFRIPEGTRIWGVYTQRINGDGSPNWILHTTATSWLQKSAYAPDSAYTETSSLDTDYWFGTPWQNYETGDSYVPWCSTNIPWTTDEAKGEAYGRGEIGADEMDNGGETSFSISTIGEDLSSQDIPEVDLGISGIGCHVYAMSKADIIDLMQNYLYVTNQSLIDDIKDGIWYWGNNPIDFFIDCYYVPLDITDFYSTSSGEMKFGSYTFTGSSFTTIDETDGTRLKLFETSFEGIYNNWRDYTQFDYELYLPFYGFFKLDPQKYINKMVKCEMSFDITTHNLRYYLYADGIISDRVDGSVGINIPLMASDMVNKAKNDRAAIQGAATGFVSGIANATKGDLAGAVGNIINMGASLERVNNKATESVSGSFSSAMNVYDIRYCYLKITEKQLIIPDQVNVIYNYPSYYMGVASALSGYCEIADIQLSCAATDEEIAEIKSLLKGGVIF